MQAMTRRIADAVLDPIKDSVDAVKSFLGIHRPSRMIRARRRRRRGVRTEHALPGARHSADRALRA